MLQASRLTLMGCACTLALTFSACKDDSKDSSASQDGGPAGGAGAAAAGDPLVIATHAGKVHGGSTDGVRHFLGIPYAAPPVGELRWRAPKAAEAWSDTRDGTLPGAKCPQIDPGTRAFDGDEDCLYLNVYTPEDAAAGKLPVMVWFHGGAFVFGHGADTAYDGTHLAKRGDVVIVTINYRLGALGFLAHEGLGSTGNFGLLDQRAALQWVKDNIAAFGGDPKSVTIFGESAGARSVCMHVVSEPSQGLFQRAIAESGFCTKPAYTLSQAQAQGGRFAKALGCSDSDATKALACLQGKTPTELVNGAQQADPLPGGILYQERSAQTVFEPIVDGVDLTMQPRELLAKGKLADVPLLHGANADEGVLFHASVLGNVVPVADQKEYEAALGRVYEASDVAKIVAQYPVKDYASANDALSAVSGDAAFLCPARTTARLLQAQGATSYEYQFSALLEGGPIPALKGKAFHSGELPYVWGNPYALGKIAAGSEAVADAMQDAFLAFAKTGDPNAAGAASPWPAYDSKADKAMHFAATSAEVTSGVREEQCDFWDTIVPKLQP